MHVSLHTWAESLLTWFLHWFGLVPHLYLSSQNKLSFLQGQLCRWHVDLHVQQMLHASSTSGEESLDESVDAKLSWIYSAENVLVSIWGGMPRWICWCQTILDIYSRVLWVQLEFTNHWSSQIIPFQVGKLPWQDFRWIPHILFLEVLKLNYIILLSLFWSHDVMFISDNVPLNTVFKYWLMIRFYFYF